jgi:hypothetical protein
MGEGNGVEQWWGDEARVKAASSTEAVVLHMHVPFRSCLAVRSFGVGVQKCRTKVEVREA